RPAKTTHRNIRREDTPNLTLELEPIPDLVATVAGDPDLAKVFRLGFAAEDSALDARAVEKMKRKGLHAIVANDISRHDIGFGSEYNAGVLLFADRYWLPLIECIRAMLPPRVRGTGSAGWGASSRQRRHTRLLELATGPFAPAEPVTLTAEQRAAIDVIGANPVTLLHGVIASGKTEVYLAAAERALAAGLRVLLLVPEISLTPQLVQRVRARLNAPVALLQSQLTELERAQQWWRTRRGEAQVVLGSRSAVFAPIPPLGLICLDEEGSAAYKQDRTPRYETGWVARRLASVTGAWLVMGSA